MQHVGIGQHDVGALAYGLAGILRRVAIIGESPYFRAHLLYGGLQLVELVFGQGLSRKKVQRAGPWVARDEVQYGEVVAQRFAAGGRGDHYHVLVFTDRLEGFRLVGIELVDAAVLEGLAQGGVKRLGQVLKDTVGGGLVANRTDRRPRLVERGLETRQGRFERRAMVSG